MPSKDAGYPIDKEQAELILGPYLDILGECISKAWKEWSDFYAPKHHILDARARAAILYCHLKSFALDAFSVLPGTVCKIRNGLFFVFVGDGIKLRFKKADQRGRTSNVMTKQQSLLEFNLQLPGMESGALLNVCYQLDDLHIKLERSMVTHQLKRSVKWEIPLNQFPAAAEGTSTTPMPVNPNTDSSRPRVKPKAGLVAKKRKTNSES